MTFRDGVLDRCPALYDSWSELRELAQTTQHRQHSTCLKFAECLGSSFLGGKSVNCIVADCTDARAVVCKCV